MKQVTILFSSADEPLLNSNFTQAQRHSELIYETWIEREYMNVKKEKKLTSACV